MRTRPHTVSIWSLLGLVALCVVTSTTYAASLESLLMPGEVIEGHAKYENECHRCHVLIRDNGQRQFCLECHKKVRSDIEQHHGFHGRDKVASHQECQECHTEHKGRSADIVKLNEATFDHRLTDFELHGAHREVSCAACHKADKKFREAAVQCSTCHKDDNPHKGRLGRLESDCAACHGPSLWNSIKFDHDKTEFALTGKHETTLCAACHPNDRVDKTPRQCVSCHQLNDVHNGRNGDQCKKCHSTRSWKKLAFDHNKDTKFALHGRHEKAPCQSCHREDPYKVKLKRNCYACHQYDDEHKGRYGLRCETCHRDSGWEKTNFDHQADTKFPLQGNHVDTACDACHLANLYDRKLPTDCYSCHDLDDPHSGEEGKRCERCHAPAGWRKKVRFDHDVTHFPLIGIHAAAACEECHLSPVYKQSPSQCNACHKHQDPHKSALGTQCERCHTPNGWQVWSFDHNRDSEFHINGAHEKVHCDACHFDAVETMATDPRTCIACHRRDDAHRGQFGPRCGRCHDTDSFQSLTLRQTRQQANRTE